MRILVSLLAACVALLITGMFLLPLLLAHAPDLVGGIGFALLLAGLLIRRRHRCDGVNIHCSGCKH